MKNCGVACGDGLKIGESGKLKFGESGKLKFAPRGTLSEGLSSRTSVATLVWRSVFFHLETGDADCHASVRTGSQ